MGPQVVENVFSIARDALPYVGSAAAVVVGSIPIVNGLRRVYEVFRVHNERADQRRNRRSAPTQSTE